jgi:hypothetical protein
MASLGSEDKILGYLIKSAVRAFRYYKSSSWEQTTALVTGHIVLDPCLGCPSVKLHYKFDYDGRSIKGWDVIPFTGLYKAKYYAESFTHNMPRTIRVNPRNSHETRFFEQDQVGLGLS